MNRQSRGFLLAGSVALLMPLSAQAASSDAEAAEAAEASRSDIIVTGERVSETVLPDRPISSIYGLDATVLDTPRSISQVNGAQLLRDPLASTDDFVKYAPGITRGGGQGNNAAPSIRGIGAEVFQNGQRIYADPNDHPLNLNAFEGADIVSGPSSVIFGPTSGTGGYVNYLTKKPYWDKQHSQITAGVGTWTPGDDSFSDYNLTLDTGGPISDKLAYRISIKGQRGGTYYDTVKNNYNSFYGALSWKPASNVRVDWNGSYDNYYDFNITRGWNRPTQALIDSFGKEYNAGRSTPLIFSPGVGLWSPVFGSSDPTAAPIGWQARTQNPQARQQYLPGTVQTTPLPSARAAGAGTILGWVYDPSIPGNGAQPISASTGSGRGEDRNSAKRYISQLQIGVDLSERWNLLWSNYFQRSVSLNDSVGSFIFQNRSTVFDTRLEFRGRTSGDLFGLPIELQSNSGVSGRFLKFSAKSANMNFTFNPYDLSLDPSTITPSALYGLPQRDANASGSWIGAPGVPQLSPYFGYLNLPAMVPVNDGFYAETGGFFPTGALYTSAGHLNQVSFFTQQNIRFADAAGINLGVNITQVHASIRNPVALTADQNYSDKRSYTLPSYQASAYVKPTRNTTLYATYDRSVAVNTGIFGNFLTWGFGNKLDDNAFNSVSELFEAGVKADIIPGKLFASTSIFKQYRDTSPDTNGNIARVKIKGVESSLRFQPTENLSGGLNFTYLDAVNTFIVPFGLSGYGFVADNATAFGDNNLLSGLAPGRYAVPGVPKYSLNGFVDYHLSNGLGAELSAWYTGKFYTNISQTVTVPDGYQANLSVYYRQPRFDVAVRVINFTNQHNFLNALAGGEFLQPLPPRAVQAQFSARF